MERLTTDDVQHRAPVQIVEFLWLRHDEVSSPERTLSVDGKTVDTHRIPSTICCTPVWFEGLDVGGDYSTPVDNQYASPNKFTGTVAQVVFNNSPLKLTAEQQTDYYQRLYAAAKAIQ